MKCGRYAGFEIVEGTERKDETRKTIDTWVRIRCKKCGEQWMFCIKKEEKK
jgi:hypothetical protein